MTLDKVKTSDHHGETSIPETTHFGGALFGRIYSILESNGGTRNERLSDTKKPNLPD
jgi:hypothetical protein